MDDPHDRVLAFIRVLTSDVSGEQLKAALVDLYGDEAAKPGFTQALAESLNVTNVLQRQRRQTLELAALHDTAVEMSATHDMAGVLRAICRRARTLVGTDVAYVALHDPDSHTSHIRATEGVVSQGFLGLELPRGAGIGGLVAELGEPIWSGDYLADARFVHTSHLDRAVSGESLRALIGVPIWADAEQIGVLMAGNRDPRPFGQEDVNLLRSLAAHAAVAIHSAWTFAATQEALDELGRANELVRAHSKTIERSVDMHERLTKVLIEGGGLTEILCQVSELVGGHVAVVDPEGIVIETAGHPLDELGELMTPGAQLARSPHQHPELWRPADSASDAASANVRLADECLDRTVAYLRARGEQLGALVVTHSSLNDGDRRNVERTAMVISLLLVNQGALAEAEMRARGDLIYDVLVREHADADDLLVMSARSGLHLDRPHVVICASIEAPGRGHARAEGSRLAAELGGIAGLVEGRLVFVVPGADDVRLASIVHRRLSLIATATVSSGGPAGGVPGLRGAYRDALHAQRLLQALDLPGSVGTSETLGLFGILLQGAAPGELREFIDSLIGAVHEYDASHGTHLQQTLKTFLDNGGHLVRTAGDLHVHVNTLYSRLARLDAILGENWREADQRMQLHLALRLNELAARIEGDGSRE